MQTVKNATRFGRPMSQKPDVENQSDEALVSAAKTDADAAGKLFDKYFGQISNFIYHCTFDKQLTEDLTANVFISAFENLSGYEWRRVPFSAWLYRIASNELKMHFRKHNRARLVSIDSYLENSRALASETDTPAAEFARAEDVRILHEVLEQLGAKYCIVISLRYFEDKTIFEISQIIGRREATVKSRLQRALKRLRGILTKRGVFSDGKGIQL